MMIAIILVIGIVLVAVFLNRDSGDKTSGTDFFERCSKTPSFGGPGEDLWRKWPEEIHSEPAQQTRVKQLNDISVISEYDPVNQIAVYNRFTVTPLNCTCSDFQKRQKPCKHMYYLMSELYNDAEFFKAAYPKKDSWGNWDSKIHSVYNQQKRQNRIKDVVIEKINNEQQTATINGCSVTLGSCSCKDFQQRQIPCKHIYRLANELSLFSIKQPVYTMQSIPNTLEAIREKIHSLSNSARLHFHDILAYRQFPNPYRKDAAEMTFYETRQKGINFAHTVNELMAAGLIIKSYDPSIVYSLFTKEELLALMDDPRYSPKKSWSKPKCIDFFVANYPEKSISILERSNVIDLPTEVKGFEANIAKIV